LVFGFIFFIAEVMFQMEGAAGGCWLSDIDIAAVFLAEDFFVNMPVFHEEGFVLLSPCFFICRARTEAFEADKGVEAVFSHFGSL